MKKRSILSLFVAIAIAVSCMIVPPGIGTGLDVVASAADITGGGITLTKVGATDITATDETYMNSLQVGSYVQLNITIPDLTHTLNGMQLRIYYNKNVFSVTQWYADASHTTWPYAGDTLTGFIGYAGTDAGSNGVLSIASANNNQTITALNGSQQTLKAIFRVNNLTQETNFKFFIVLEDDFVETVTATGGTEKIAHDVFTYDDRGYTFFSYRDDVTGTDQIINWIPDTGKKVITGKISRSVTAQLKDGENGIDFDYYSDEFEEHPLKITVYKAGNGYAELVNDLYWLSGNELDDYLEVITVADVAEDGSFVLTGIENGSYYLKLNCWGKFVVTNGSNTTLKDYYPLTISGSGSLTTAINTPIQFWMFGDVDRGGTIGATDATAILKFIVGKTSSITSASSNEYKIGNVYTEDNLNVRDATQILRKSAYLSSVFDTKPPYA